MPFCVFHNWSKSFVISFIEILISHFPFSYCSFYVRNVSFFSFYADSFQFPHTAPPFPLFFFILLGLFLLSNSAVCLHPTRSVQSEADAVRGPLNGTSQVACSGTGRARQTAHLQQVCVQRESAGEEGHFGWQRPQCRCWGHSGVPDPLGQDSASHRNTFSTKCFLTTYNLAGHSDTRRKNSTKHIHLLWPMFLYISLYFIEIFHSCSISSV